MVFAGFHGEAVFAVRFLELAGRAVHGDHADLFLGPLLNGFVRQLHRNLTRSLDHHGSAHLLAVGIHRQVGRKSSKIRLPSGRALEGPLEQGAGLGVVGNGGLCIDRCSMFHQVLLCVVVKAKS